MDNSKEPKVTERGVVIVDASLRKHVRKKLRADLVEARVALTPQILWQKMLARNKAKAKNIVVDAGIAARDNAPVVGVIGLGVLLFVARRPISKWISQLWHGTKNKINYNRSDET